MCNKIKANFDVKKVLSILKRCLLYIVEFALLISSSYRVILLPWSLISNRVFFKFFLKCEKKVIKSVFLTCQRKYKIKCIGIIAWFFIITRPTYYNYNCINTLSNVLCKFFSRFWLFLLKPCSGTSLIITGNDFGTLN